MTIDTAIQSSVAVYLLACCFVGILSDAVNCKPEHRWFVPYWHTCWTVLIFWALIHLGTFR